MSDWSSDVCSSDLQRRLPDIPRTTQSEPLYARIDAGRWIAECPCGSAHVVSPTDPHMLCTVCLDSWHPLIFPADPEAAEAEVDAQPRRHQFWYHPGDERWQAERFRQAEQAAAQAEGGDSRSEERRVGKECVSTGRYRGSPEHEKKK